MNCKTDEHRLSMDFCALSKRTDTLIPGGWIFGGRMTDIKSSEDSLIFNIWIPLLKLFSGLILSKLPLDFHFIFIPFYHPSTNLFF